MIISFRHFYLNYLSYQIALNAIFPPKIDLLGLIGNHSSQNWQLKNQIRQWPYQGKHYDLSLSGTGCKGWTFLPQNNAKFALNWVDLVCVGISSCNFKSIFKYMVFIEWCCPSVCHFSKLKLGPKIIELTEIMTIIKMPGNHTADLEWKLHHLNFSRELSIWYQPTLMNFIILSGYSCPVKTTPSYFSQDL